MTELVELTIRAGLIGAGATAAMDLWGVLAMLLFGARPADYAMVGRWIGHMPKGRFVHDAIARAAPVPGERALGWTAHYGIGIVFAFILLATFGLEWAHSPTLLPALAVGLATLIAPFLIMQPGMGAGIAASRTPAPNTARARSPLTHTIFGLGLYGTALLMNAAF